MLRYRSILLFISLVCAMACARRGLNVETTDDPPLEQRFFLEGDGRLALENLKTGKQGMFVYRLPDGTYPQAVRQEINELFGLEDDPVVENISLRFVALLDYIQDQYGDGAKPIRMNSAYRAPDYNQRLREQGGTVAKASTHMEGMAADLNIDGVDGKYLWESLRAKECCGVGWYGGASVHVDSAEARFWTGATSKVRTDISANNKKILLQSEFDIYRRGERVQLALLRVTVFPFGVKRRAEWLEQEDGSEKAVARVDLNFADDNGDDCVMIHDRVEARALSLRVPEKRGGEPGARNVKIDFCAKPNPEMPDSVLSNPVRIQ